MKAFLRNSKEKLKVLSVHVNLLWLKIIAREITVKFKNVLVLSPHYDDEVIGVGGIITQTLQNGGKVYIVFLSDGQNTGSFPDKGRIAKERCLLAEKVLREYNIPQEHVWWLHLPDESVPRKGKEGFFAIRDKISEVIDFVKPDTVLATHYLDKHTDHVACYELAEDAVNQADHKSVLWLYMVWGWFRVFPWEYFQTLKIRKVSTGTENKKKKELLDIYLIPESPTGAPWSGILPRMMYSPLSHEFIQKCDYRR